MPDAKEIIDALFGGLTDSEIDRIAARMRIVREHGYGALILTVEKGRVVYSEITIGDKLSGVRGRDAGK